MERTFTSIVVLTAAIVTSLTPIVWASIATFKWQSERFEKRKDLSNKIWNRYYVIIRTVQNIHEKISRFSCDRFLMLQEVNQLLHKLHDQHCCIASIDLESVRRLFSEKARQSVRKLDELLPKLANERNDVSNWSVQANSVNLFAGQILREWNLLLKIIARKRHITLNGFKREHDE